MLLRVLRVVRILRILRLLKDKRAKGLRDLLMTMVLSFPSLINVGSLLGLLLFMYAVLGVQLFTFVQHGDPLDDDRNFDTFGSALLLLFQALTGHDWAALMHGCMITPGDSGCTLEAADCGSSAAVAFFVSFQFLGSFVLLNLVVAVILENFTSLGRVNPDLVSSTDIANFREAWADFDPDANQLIPADQLPELLVRIPPPLGPKEEGVSDEEARKRAVRHCLRLDLTEYDGEVQFQDVLDALVNNNYKNGLRAGLPGAETGPDEVKELVHARARRNSGNFEESSYRSLTSSGRVSDDGADSELGTLPRRESRVLKQFASQIIRSYIRKNKPVPEDTPPLL